MGLGLGVRIRVMGNGEMGNGEVDRHPNNHSLLMINNQSFFYQTSKTLHVLTANAVHFTLN